MTNKEEYITRNFDNLLTDNEKKYITRNFNNLVTEEDSITRNFNNLVTEDDCLTTFLKNLSLDNRPTFYYLFDNNSPIRAGGVIIYRKINNITELLLIKKKDRYEDIGGKTDVTDENELDTVSREVYEETNSVINKDIIKKQLTYSKSCYCLKSKYILYFVKANIYQKKLISENFGDNEIHDNIERSIEWINSKIFLENSLFLHPRLLPIFENIKKIIQTL